MTTRARAAEILSGKPPGSCAIGPEICRVCVHRAMATERVSDPVAERRLGILFAFCQRKGEETPEDFGCADFERRS